MAQDIFTSLRFSNVDVDYRITQFQKSFSEESSAFEGHSVSSIPDKCYAIAAVARVGATFLSNMLSIMGLGTPSEYFNIPFNTGSEEPVRWSNYINDTICKAPENSGKAVMANRKVFGAKVGIHDLIPFLDNRYEWPFGFRSWSWIYMTREDIVGQAISLEIARQSNEWNSEHEHGARGSVKYSSNEIDNCVNVILNDMLRWEAFFCRFNIMPLRITYEDAERDPFGVLSRICTHLDVDGKELFVKSGAIRKQRDEINTAWRELYTNGR